MSLFELEVLVPGWTIGITVGAWLTRRLDSSPEPPGSRARTVVTVILAAVLVWVLLLTVAIVVALLGRATSDPVVRYVLVAVFGVMGLVAWGWGVATMLRKRHAEARRRLE